FTFFSVIPPLASNWILSFLKAIASRICAGVMLSRRMTSMPQTSQKRVLAPGHRPRLQCGCLAALYEADEFDRQKWKVPQTWPDDCPLRAPCRTSQSDDSHHLLQPLQPFPMRGARAWFCV